MYSNKIFIFIFIVTLGCKNKSTLPGFEIDPNLKIDLVASEPLINDPVDIDFDTKGNLWVLEMPGYPFEDSTSRLKILKDTNADGKMDAYTVFARNLNMASSFLHYQKGVLVTASPYLLFLKDENEDEIADKVDTLMGGFSTGNLQHNANGMTYGLDNWIYVANGGNDGKPYWWGDEKNAVNLNGHDIRINIEQRKLEIWGESSGGYGIAMDEFGRFFSTHNTNHVSQMIFPATYMSDKKLLFNHTLNNISDHEENGLSRVYPIGEQESRVNHPEQSGYFSGSCGISYYGDDELGEKYKGSIWVADVVLNLIHVDQLEQNESSAFKAKRILDKKEVLASSDRAFRPVNTMMAPDGSVYIVDMYRKVIEHPEWIPDEIEKNLDLNAGKNKGRIYQIKKRSNHPLFNNELFSRKSELSQLLQHKNQWVRKTAHRLLMENDLDEESVSFLKTQLDSQEQYARLHAGWILHLKNKLSDQDLIKLLSDPVSGIRENALIISEQYLEKELVFQAALNCLKDKDQRVRMQAGLTISKIPNEILVKNKSEILKSLIVSSKLLLDEWNIGAITLAIKNEDTLLFKQLSEDPKASIQLLKSLSLSAANSVQHLKTILEIASGIQNIDTRKEIMRQISSIEFSSFNNEQLAATIQNIEKTNDVSLITSMAKIRRKINLPPSKQYIEVSKLSLEKIKDRSRSEKDRLEDLTAIEMIPYQMKSNVLFSCLDSREPMKIQETALLQLSNYKEKEIGHKIVSLWSTMGPQIRKYASDLLIYVDVHHDALLTALENKEIQIGEMNFDLERRRALLFWTEDKTIRARAEKLFSDVEITTRETVIKKMTPALTLKADASNGKIVFQNVCSNCHMYKGIGYQVGPVLDEISRKSKETIMHEILDPNSAADTKFIQHRLEVSNGPIHLGIISAENDQYISILKMRGEEVSIKKSDIKNLSSSGRSYMPEGLESVITVQQMADLLSYLQK